MHEQMQTSQEELKSANEELQSTNEELTTSKEEMQSLNEELQTVNAEQTARMGKAARQRVTDLFTWPRRAEQIAQIYDWVLGRSPARPEPIKHS